jgi:hypothetical protein
VFLKALLGGYDVIHVHSFDKCVPLLSRVAPVVLHYHGSDIRGRWSSRERYWKHAERIIVSTRNILEGAPPIADYLPNPIDTEMFKPLPVEHVDAALHIDYGAVDIAERIAGDHGLRLVVVKKGIVYAEMPLLMNRYTHYVDAKRDYAGRVLVGKSTDTGSLVGLQALACGLTVLNLSGERRGLPLEHRPENVAESLFKLYGGLLG